jgi:hypothetical protein
MKRAWVLVAAVGAAVTFAVAAQAGALSLNWQNIAGSQCKSDTARQLVNVSFNVVNDYDSGFAGNAWANDTITRNLRVWQVGATYCAQVSDRGSFTTFAGTSPSGTRTVSAGVPGDIAGGYVTTFFTGTFDPSGPYATHGDLGTFDLQCTDASNCPGAHPTPESYFGSTSGFDLSHWGWIYHAGSHGTWLNQDGTSAADGGDITG